MFVAKNRFCRYGRRNERVTGPFGMLWGARRMCANVASSCGFLAVAAIASHKAVFS
jgi:hypothetical protein